MKNSKKILKILFLCFSLLIIGRISFAYLFNSISKISVTNNTNQIIKNLKLEYACGEIFENIPKLDIHESQKYKSDTTKIDFGDNRVDLTYKDKSGKMHNHVAIGYLERGYREQASVLLKNINENGELEVLVDGRPSTCIICETK
ncbi:MAG: hypothetical protein ACRCWM_08560 [Sarcina sp.]